MSEWEGGGQLEMVVMRGKEGEVEGNGENEEKWKR